MISISKMLKRIHQTSEYIGKARVLSGLRAMDPNWLEEHGYSVAALNRGVEAWPWRKDEQPQTATAPTVTNLRTRPASPAPDHAADRDREDAA